MLTPCARARVWCGGSHHVDTWEQLDPGIDAPSQLTPWFAGWAGSGWYQGGLPVNDGGMSRLGLTSIYWVRARARAALRCPPLTPPPPPGMTCWVSPTPPSRRPPLGPVPPPRRSQPRPPVPRPPAPLYEGRSARRVTRGGAGVWAAVAGWGGGGRGRQGWWMCMAPFTGMWIARISKARPPPPQPSAL